MHQEITAGLYLSAILSSTVIATVIGIFLNWRKEYLQKKTEKEDKQFQHLYGSVIYNLLMLKVLDINRKELINEIKDEPIPEETDAFLKKWADVNPINAEWRKFIYKLKDVFENNAGYIKKEHFKLVEDLLDGLVKRDITRGGESSRTNKERIEKIFEAIDALTNELIR